MDNNELEPFCKLFTVVAGYYGRDKSRDSAMLYWNALKPYPFDLVKQIMDMHVRTSKFMPMVSDILDFLRKSDGRPEPQEAWASVAKCFKNEAPTIVWTDEMAQAMIVADGCDDAIAARMAFLESYKSLCQQARDAGKPAKWTQCLGTDRAGRDGPLLAAVASGKLPPAHAQQFLIGDTAASDLKSLAAIKARVGLISA